MRSSVKSIVVLIAAGAALLIGLLWAGTYYQLRAERERAVASATRENENRVIAFEQYVARALGEADIAAVHLVDKFAGTLDPAAPGVPPRLLEDPVAANPQFAGVTIADARGDIRWARPAGGPAFNVAFRPAFRSFRAGAPERPFIADPTVSQVLRRPVIALTRAIRRPDGRFDGTVTVQIPVERLTAFNEGATIRPLDLISVISLEGMTLARREGQRVSYGEDLRGRLVMRQQYRDPNGTYLGPSSIDGVRRYFSHRRLDAYPIFVTVGVGEEDVLRDIADRSRRYRLAIAALSVAIAAFAWSLARGIVRRERAARDLAESNARLREAQRIGRIGDWEYDPTRQAFIWSDHLCTMYARPCANDRLGRDELLAYLEPASRATFMTTLDETLASGESRQAEVTVAGDGRATAVHRYRFVPVAGASGSVDKLVGTTQDVTSEKLHERLRDEVAHLARIDAMNAMAGTVAHELAQPLTAAANFLRGTRRLAARGAPGDEALVRDGLQQVEQQIELARKIMTRARDMVSRGRIGEESASVADIVEDALALVAAANDYPAVRIERRLAPEASHVAADKVQVQQVLMNLLRNACEAAAGADDPRVTIASRCAADGSVVLCVGDNGRGLPAGLDIFSPFASTKSGGLGLGLSISRAIVESHGGRIWVDKGEAATTAICFSLPAGPAR